MAIARSRLDLSAITFSRGEVTGAIGDTVTVLPIVVALATLTPISLPHTLLAFGVFQVVWGVWYGLPMSVEPMKALAALAIAGTLTYSEFLLAGLVSGVVLLALGTGGGLARAERFVGRPVVRGVQLAVALLLARTGLDLALGDPTLALAGLAITVLAIAIGRANVAALLVLGLGVGITTVLAGAPALTVPGVPAVPLGKLAPSVGVLEGALAQLAMTVGNAAVATSLLVSDFFDRELSPDELSRGMGAMTLLSIPLGGVPMCHGSGGLAGKHAFGARSAGANVVLGVLYGLAALVAGGGFFALFPMSTLGIVLVLVAWELGKSALGSESKGLTAAIGALGLLANVGVAFVCGIAGYWLLEGIHEEG
ncbi:sulfate transporter [Halobacteriales archaeon QS_3_64_16]|nr:MAG: sulfate transporter [Halobacteriales archaeon QS_3_64_16]